MCKAECSRFGQEGYLPPEMSLCFPCAARTSPQAGCAGVSSAGCNHDESHHVVFFRVGDTPCTVVGIGPLGSRFETASFMLGAQRMRRLS